MKSPSQKETRVGLTWGRLASDSNGAEFLEGWFQGTPVTQDGRTRPQLRFGTQRFDGFEKVVMG